MCLFGASALAAEMCKLDGLEKQAANSADCHFYHGTSAYRAGDFATAADYWKRLVALKEVPVDEEHLQASAYNNLGFLYYFGKGVKANKPEAIAYWHRSSKAGNEEAAYHLCHVYADKKVPTFDPKLGGEYCRETLRRYGLLKKSSENTNTILHDAQAYLRKMDQ